MSKEKENITKGITAKQLEQISMFQTAKSPFLVYSKPYSYVVRVNGLKEKENLKILLTRKGTSFTFLLDEYDGVEYIHIPEIRDGFVGPIPKRLIKTLKQTKYFSSLEKFKDYYETKRKVKSKFMCR